jgi:hypothetical protein
MYGRVLIDGCGMGRRGVYNRERLVYKKRDD